MNLFFAGSASKNEGLQRSISGGGIILNHLATYADLPEIKSKLDCMFLHLTDTTARNTLCSYGYPLQQEQ